MNEELRHIEDLILRTNGLQITGITEDQDCEAYEGCSFRMGDWNIKYRKAKITPKKAGHFVTLWKRNSEGQTAPFSMADGFDFYIIAAEWQKQCGFFLFPQHVLSEKQILTANQKEGKRGFRVYTGWDITPNKQAERTKAWQTKYFMDLSWEPANPEKFNSIINGDWLTFKM